MAGRPKKNVIKRTGKVPLRLICQECSKEKSSSNFYNTNSDVLPKYPICKECMGKVVNPSDVKSAYRVLKDMNIAFIKTLWDICTRKHPDNPFAHYLRQMNSLPQYRGLQWSGSVFDYEEIDGTSVQISDELIHNIEWMGNYSLGDIRYLEEYLGSLRSDFKIVTRNHIDYAKKIAKASLAMDRAYQDMLNGGSESKYKMMKEIFDSLSKSAQFAESERGINDVSLGCFGVVFDKVEKRMHIPQHQPDNPDLYDKLLDQFANINRSL